MDDVVYSDSQVKLIHGDCLETMPFLTATVDMVLADLPYGTTRQGWDRPIDNKLLWHCWRQLCGDRSPIVAFGTGMFGARLLLSNEADYRYTLCWDKDSVTGHLNAKKQPLRSHEDIHVFYRKQCTYNPQMVDTGRKSHSRGKRIDRTNHHYGAYDNTPVPEEQQGQYPRSILKFPRPKEGLHPNQKPLELCRWLIRTYTNPGDLVLDPVAGSGTTLLAARLEGRRAVGIEGRGDYCAVAAQRLEAA